MKIYVASSWRNPWQPGVVTLLRSLGHEVYDFRNPTPGETGFSWSEVDPEWKAWRPDLYREGLRHPIAQRGFKSDRDALVWCEACVAVQPYGTSTALEVGWASGAGKRTSILFPLGMATAPIGGHSADQGEQCVVCSDVVTGPRGCALPAKLEHVEPELMALLTDQILVGQTELEDWVSDDWPRRPT